MRNPHYHRVPTSASHLGGVTIQSSSRLSFRFGLSLFSEIRRRLLPRVRIPPHISPDFSPAFPPHGPWNQKAPLVPLHLKPQGWQSWSPKLLRVYFLPDAFIRLAVASGQKHASPKLRSGCIFGKLMRPLKVKLRWLIFGLSRRIR